MSDIHICWARVDNFKIRFSRCPTCKKKRKFWCWFQEWYGWDETCLSCGDSWQDGEMRPRPFMPKWREKSIRAAEEHMKKVKGG